MQSKSIKDRNFLKKRSSSEIECPKIDFSDNFFFVFFSLYDTYCWSNIRLQNKKKEMDEGYDRSVVIDIKPVRELAESPEREGGGGGGISVVLDDDSGYDSDPVAGPVFQPFLLSAAES